MGIPHGVAIQNHLINENLLWSFFPGGKNTEGDISSGDEEHKNYNEKSNENND